MAESGDMKKLEMRIGRIEQLVESLAGRSEATDLSEGEIKAYQKVRDVIAADWGEFCGINDCFRCIIVRCIQRCITLCDIICNPCDTECSCGPCGYGGFRGNLRRFSGMGG